MPSPRGPLLPKPPSSERRVQARAYEGAFEAAVAVIAAAGLGYWADSYFESSPIGLLVGVIVGFAAMVLRLLRLGRQLGLSEPSHDQGDQGNGED